MTEKKLILYTPTKSNKHPFVIIDESKTIRRYNRDQLKKMGEKYDLAAHNTIISGKWEEICWKS